MDLPPPALCLFVSDFWTGRSPDTLRPPLTVGDWGRNGDSVRPEEVPTPLSGPETQVTPSGLWSRITVEDPYGIDV